MSGQESLNRIRTQIQEIAERVKSEPEYMQRIKDDPLSTLSAAGLPKEMIQQLIDGKAEEAEVSGYRYVDDVCNDGTCWSSNCPESCYVTF